MDFFVHPGEPPGRPPRNKVARGEVKRWLETIYRDVYHCAPDDPRLAQMLATLPDPVPLD